MLYQHLLKLTCHPNKRENLITFGKMIKNFNIYYDKIQYTTKTQQTDSNKDLRKKIKKQKKYLINKFYQNEAEKINLNALNREMKELFENSKNHKSLPKSQPKLYCKPEKLAKHFENHFASKTHKFKPSLLESPPTCIVMLTEQSSNMSINEAPPSTQEIQAIINNLKSNKSSTDISVEILKTLSNSKIINKELESFYAKI